jgi:hypothetical protein
VEAAAVKQIASAVAGREIILVVPDLADRVKTMCGNGNENSHYPHPVPS